MADKLLEELTENTAPLTSDILYIVDDPAGSPLGQKITLANLLGGIAGDVVFNEGGGNYDFRVESVANAKMLWIDADNSFVAIGGAIGATVGQIANFGPNSIIFSEDGADRNFRVESNDYTDMFNIDGGNNTVGIGTGTEGAIASFSNTGVIFNEDSNDRDFRVESNGDANCLIVDGGTDAVSIGAAAAALSTTKGKLQVTVSGAYHALSLHNDNAAGLRIANSTAAGGGSGANLWMEADITPSAADQRIAVFALRGITTGTTYKPAARIDVWSGEAWDATHSGGYMVFSTTPTGTVAVAEALRIQMDGTLKLSNAASWTANGTATVTISNVAPAGVGTATISKWLTITDNAGTVMYIPAFT